MRRHKSWKCPLPFYINELFVPSRYTYKTISNMALEIPLRKSNLGPRIISFLVPSLWNKLNNDLKTPNTHKFDFY